MVEQHLDIGRNDLFRVLVDGMLQFLADFTKTIDDDLLLAFGHMQRFVRRIGEERVIRHAAAEQCAPQQVGMKHQAPSLVSVGNLAVIDARHLARRDENQRTLPVIVLVTPVEQRPTVEMLEENTVKTEVFQAVSDARARLAGAGSINEKVDADNELSGALSRLLAITENYPDLKANQQFTALMDELSGTENRITIARQDYNETARAYNKKIATFPGVIFANMFGFEKYDYFEAAAGAENAPNVDFSK